MHRLRMDIAQPRGEPKRLLRLAERQPGEAEKVLASTLALRESLHRLLDSWMNGRRPARAELRAVNDFLQEMPRKERLLPSRGGFAWDLPARAEDLRGPLWPVAWSIGDLLTTGDVGRLKRCSGDGCGWLFYDESRVRNRRWCSMSDCGNRAKARRHYRRVKGAASLTE